MAGRKSAAIKLKLTDAVVRALDHEGDADYMRVWDSVVPGFGVKINRGGRKTFFVVYRTATDVQRWHVLGDSRAMTADAARSEAKAVQGLASKGADPHEEKRKSRSGGTLADFWVDYHADALKRWKPKTAELQGYIWAKYIKPRLGTMRVDQIRRGDVAALLRAMGETPTIANQTFRLLRAMLNKAIEWEVIPGPCPARGVKPYPAKPRERFLSPEEFHAVFSAIAEEEALGGRPAVGREGEAVAGVRGGKGLREAESRGISPHAAGLFRLLMFTGTRLREIMHARWEWVRWEERVLALPDSKTGAKRVMLSEPALAELRRLREFRTVDCPWIIEGRDGTGCLVNATKPWHRVRERAGRILNERRRAAGLDVVEGEPFADLRIHDLRHSFASVAVAEGLGLPIIGKALGHSQTRTTERYAHLSSDPVLAAAELVGRKILEAVERPGAPTVDVARIRKGGAGA